MSNLTTHHTLYHALKQYAQAPKVPMHMPGHKHHAAFAPDLPWHLDITEIDGFDNLHSPTGILREAQDRAANLWGSKDAYFLTNGSTGGLLAAIYAATHPGDKVLIARNAHKSIYHAIELLDLIPVFLEPPHIKHFGITASIPPAAVASALSGHPDIKLVVITSPTYEGVCSDIRGISHILHAHNIPLLVDEAHGAHFGLSPHFPESAVTQGADLVVQSLHKTLPSLTQTAILHHCGDRIASHRLSHAFSVFASTSPSYPLMASIDSCVAYLSEHRHTLFAAWSARLTAYREQTAGLRHIKTLSNESAPDAIFAYDHGKICLLTAHSSYHGAQLMDLFRKQYHIELEMALPNHAIAMTSPHTSDEAFTQLARAVREVDHSATERRAQAPVALPAMCAQVLTPKKALVHAQKIISLPDAAGEISGMYLWAYPPGIPLLVPGAMITEEMVACAIEIIESGGALKSSRPIASGQIYVVDNSADLL